MNRAESARFHRNVREHASGCWVWIGPQTPNGYGRWQVGPGQKKQMAHRISYEHHTGEQIPEGIQLDHVCRNRLCVNPLHLEKVTGSENTLRQDHAERRKTECPKLE